MPLLLADAWKCSSPPPHPLAVVSSLGEFHEYAPLPENTIHLTFVFINSVLFAYRLGFFILHFFVGSSCLLCIPSYLPSRPTLFGLNTLLWFLLSTEQRSLTCIKIVK